jgi:hypothetical protein
MTEPAPSPIVLLAGVPASGKSWVASRARNDFHYLPHDGYKRDKYSDQLNDYLADIVIAATNINSKKPLLIETPFSVSRIAGPLERMGFQVIVVYVLETEDTLFKRHTTRGTEARASYLTQQVTYYDRAILSDSFHGTSEEALAHILQLAKDIRS